METVKRMSFWTRTSQFIMNVSSLRLAGISAFLLVLLSTSANLHAERIKDLASIAGIRDNALLGYGLVVGLDGTGDKTMTFTNHCI